MLLGAGVLQLGTRSPVIVAQTAITLSNLSSGRFLLGLGASGPQVIEGLHGVSFARPLARMTETVEIIRRVFTGGKISYSGNEFQPRPGGEAVPMRLSARAEHEIPIYLAALSPAMLRLTGRIADGWLGTSFVPEGAAAAYFAHLDEGWPPRVAPAARSTFVKAPKSPSPPTKTNCAPWWPRVRRSWRSASAGWARQAPTTTTGPIAGKAGPTWPPRCGNAGCAVTGRARPGRSPMRWCWLPR